VSGAESMILSAHAESIILSGRYSRQCLVVAAATAATATTTTAVAAVDPTHRIGMTSLLCGAREPCPAAVVAIVVMVILVESILNPPYVEG
jgi:hypothetical protein